MTHFLPMLDAPISRSFTLKSCSLLDRSGAVADEVLLTAVPAAAAITETRDSPQTEVEAHTALFRPVTAGL